MPQTAEPPAQPPQPVPGGNPDSAVTLGGASTKAEAVGSTPPDDPSPRRRGRRAGLVVLSLAVALTALLGGAAFYRDQVMEAWPASTQLYRLAGFAVGPKYGLAIGDLAHAQRIDGEAPVLVVTGAISNVTESTVSVPRLRGALFDSESRELFAWSFDPPSRQLGVGETAEFTTRVANPPPSTRVKISFERKR